MRDIKPLLAKKPRDCTTKIGAPEKCADAKRAGLEMIEPERRLIRLSKEGMVSSENVGIEILRGSSAGNSALAPVKGK